MKVGTVNMFDEQKGYGFIVPDDGSADVYLHASAVVHAGLTGHIGAGVRVGFDPVRDRRGDGFKANSLCLAG